MLDKLYCKVLKKIGKYEPEEWFMKSLGANGSMAPDGQNWKEHAAETYFMAREICYVKNVDVLTKIMIIV